MIRFKEYSGTEKCADFTHTLHLFERKNNKKKKLKKKKKIIPTCIPYERRVEKEFKTITDYIPVVQSHLHDDGDDKATDAYDQDHEGTDHDEGAYVADNGDDQARYYYLLHQLQYWWYLGYNLLLLHHHSLVNRWYL